ncbi:MAG: disulfide oxidoreductase, partial [Deltaproteobacteria bacterium]|nr:disulfide oxidoreductase [Deltaproteobacteria bacterium]
MLEHGSGMIGLPLRLLAREVYDRLVAARGERAVALITGEEKRIPSDPRFFVCTVEAMPIDVRVPFVAVDEIQLAADRNRGHLFTHRLLHVRGGVETLFLGSDTVEDLLLRLVPDIRIERRPRLSVLRHAGSARVASLPARSAIVAFSANDVYALAERVRAAHGGAAVVLGALSPRSRNAQVALYESGEVDHLVATDAIGMGLNLDVRHVAFADLSKFDGTERRPLTPAELAQIAGRAGRFRTDGTFGTTREVGSLDPELVEAIETHRFPPVTALWWRNHELDYRSIPALMASLERPPPSRLLRAVRDADDERALHSLAGDPELAGLARTPVAVETLWEVCQIPDFRKTLTDSHVRLLAEIATARLTGNGRLGSDVLAERIRRLDRTEGDIDALMTRIAWIRTWTYVTHQRGWVEDPRTWQDEARAVEDRLSDALHERLTQRFVDRRRGAAVAVQGDVVRAGDDDVGRLIGFTWVSTDPTRSPDVARQLAPIAEARAESLLAADESEFTVEDDLRLRFRGEVVARLAAGPHPLAPLALPLPLDLLSTTLAEKVRDRVRKQAIAWAERGVAPLRKHGIAGLTQPARAVLRAVERGLGTTEAMSLPLD